MGRGIGRITRTPRESVRDRRNAQRLGGAASLMFGGVLTIDGSGTIVLTYGTGLQDDAGTLKTKDSEIVHDNLSGYIADEHIDWTSTTETLFTTGDIYISSDTSGVILGASADTKLSWDDGNTRTNLDSSFCVGANVFIADTFSSYTDLANYIDASGDPWILHAGLIVEGLTIAALAGVVVAAAGVLSASSLDDGTVGNIVFTHAGGVISGATQDGEIDHDNLASVHQDVNTTANPTFASVNLTDQNAALLVDGNAILRIPVATTLCLGRDTATPSGNYNTLIGYKAGEDLTTEQHNAFIGAYAGYTNTGSFNFGIGSFACGITTGSYNIGIGYYAAGFIDGTHTGSNNTCIGSSAGSDMQGTAHSNVCIGKSAGEHISGNANVCIGWGAGDLPNPATGSYNIFMGYDCTPAVNISYSICIGVGSRPTANRQCVIGSAAWNGYVNDVYIGYGVVDTAPGDVTLQVAGGSGTDIAAGDFIIAGGKSTGDADPGDIIFQTSVVGAAGAALQTLATRMTISDTAVTVQTGFVIPSGITPAPAVEGALFLDTDAGANGTLKCYSNGAWRTVTAF